MERKIGEIFEYNGEWLQCVEQPEKYDKTVCAICDFHGIGNCELDKCSGTYRSDKKSIIFRKLKKVGEMYEKRVSDGTSSTFQRYRVYNSVILPKEPYIYCNFIDSTVEIEIKQTKEDMEEKKVKLDKLVTDYTSNKITYNEFEKAVKEIYADKEESKPTLKPFDLEAAKAGKPVFTRDGRKARIIAFDRRLFYKNVSYPIIALVERSDGEDDVCGYNEKGKVLIEDGAEYKDDLMMLPEKKEGWVNVYYDNDASSHRGCRFIYDTKERAVKEAGSSYITTVKINWEE